MMEYAIDKALDHDIEATLQEAVRLRNEEHIRTTPQVILVRAAHHRNSKGTPLIRKYAKEIIKRADEPSTGLAYNFIRFGKTIPNSLKRAWSDYLSSRNEYQLAKYRMGSREVKLVDVVNLCHANSEPINKLMKGELSLEDQTWEAIISKEGSTKESWTKAIEKMGHMALLRNIRNFLKHGVNPSDFVGKLVETADSGQQLPFRYYSAYKANTGVPGVVLDALNSCLELSLGNLPHFSGRVMSLSDNSGSAWGTRTSSLGTMAMAEIANLTAALTARVSDEGYVGVFGDRLKVTDVPKSRSIFDETKRLSELGRKCGSGTEHGIWLFWDEAIKNREHWDHVFVYSDMQAGHGGLYGIRGEINKDYEWPFGRGGTPYIDVPKLIGEYRAKVNPDVNVYLVQVAGYQDSIIPEFYDRTYILGGWGEGLLRFAHFMENLARA